MTQTVLILAYSIDWQEAGINWIIDGTVVRTLIAASVGDQYPQTPMQVRIGTWCGGCKGEPEGTVQWSGGPTTFGSAPYVMTITNLEIDNANPAESYVYSDRSGSASSITTGGAVSLGGGNTTIGADSSSSQAVSLSQVSDPPASSSESSATGSSSAAVSSVATTSSTAVASNSTAADQTQSPVLVTTVNVGPTSNTLPNSEASRTSMSTFALLILGAFILLAQ
jgi:beta-glucanase (GH16 family)